MNKKEAILKIKDIQIGKGDSPRSFPDELKGSLFKSIESGKKDIGNMGDYVSLSYGFEYGEIYGLMKAFNISVDDIVNFEERESSKEKRKRRCENQTGLAGTGWLDYAVCTKCAAEGHYTMTSIGDYSYPTTFTCDECGQFNIVGDLNNYYLPEDVRKYYLEQLKSV